VSQLFCGRTAAIGRALTSVVGPGLTEELLLLLHCAIITSTPLDTDAAADDDNCGCVLITALVSIGCGLEITDRLIISVSNLSCNNSQRH